MLNHRLLNLKFTSWTKLKNNDKPWKIRISSWLSVQAEKEKKLKHEAKALSESYGVKKEEIKPIQSDNSQKKKLVDDFMKKYSNNLGVDSILSYNYPLVNFKDRLKNKNFVVSLLDDDFENQLRAFELEVIKSKK